MTGGHRLTRGLLVALPLPVLAWAAALAPIIGMTGPGQDQTLDAAAEPSDGRAARPPEPT